MSEATCPSCQAEGHIIGTSSDVDVYQCPGCELCFLPASVRPNSDKDNHWYGELAGTPEGKGEEYIAHMGGSYIAQLKQLEPLVNGKKVLDVGCGLGIFLAVAKRHGWEAHGVESSEHSVEFARRQYGLDYHSSLDELGANSFDVVRISHVLEHIPEPLGFLVALKRVLKPGGVLAIIVPNREPLTCLVKNKLKGALSKKPALSGAIYPDMHVLGLSRTSLRNLLRRVGYQAEQVQSVSMGNPTFYPTFYDGLLRVERLGEISPGRLLRFYLPQLLDNIGNRFGRGTWVVGYFRKP